MWEFRVNTFSRRTTSDFLFLWKHMTTHHYTYLLYNDVFWLFSDSKIILSHNNYFTFVRLLVGSFIQSFIHSFIHSFTHSFIHVSSFKKHTNITTTKCCLTGSVCCSSYVKHACLILCLLYSTPLHTPYSYLQCELNVTAATTGEDVHPTVSYTSTHRHTLNANRG